MVGADITRALVVLVIVLALAGYLSFEYSFRIGSVYGLIAIFALIGYYVLANYPHLGIYFIFLAIPMWYMINSDYNIGGTYTLLGLGAVVLYILYKEVL